jgi:hypothetical protein
MIFRIGLGKEFWREFRAHMAKTEKALDDWKKAVAKVKENESK